MDAHEYANLEQRLRSRGWTKDAAGTWTAPGKGGGDVLGPVEARPTERAKVEALDGGVKQRKASKGSVAVRVVLVSCRHRLSDDDAVAASLKPCRDAVAASLGIDDGDARVRFECSQARTDGDQGVLVKVEWCGENEK